MNFPPPEYRQPQPEVIEEAPPPRQVEQQCRFPFVKTARGCECARGYQFSRAKKRCYKIQVVEPKPVEPPAIPPLPKPRPVQVAAAPGQCLPQDLYDELTAAYGTAPSISACEAACLPKPTGYSEGELASLSTKFAVNWCEQCISLGGYLPLEDIHKLEQLTGQTFCMKNGGNICSAPGYASVAPVITITKVRELIRQYPLTVGKQGDIAVVIGNEVYGGDLTPNSNGKADADAVITLLTEQLGYRKNNIIDLRDATIADLRRVFGRGDGTDGELHQLFAGRKDGNVFVYISSHGLRDAATGKSYILPVDGVADHLSDTALAVEDLYQSIGKLGARTSLLAMEVTFSSRVNHLVDPPNLPAEDFSVWPEQPVPGLAVFTASDRDQQALNDPEFGIGLFTRFLIEGMAGKADESPTGNADRQIDSVELHVYTAHMVRQAARKSFGLEQKPLLSKVDNLLIGRLASR